MLVPLKKMIETFYCYIIIYVSLINNIFLFTGKAIKGDENKTHWKAVPVLCFQNNLPLQSALEVCFFPDKAENIQKFINKLSIIYKSLIVK